MHFKIKEDILFIHPEEIFFIVITKEIDEIYKYKVKIFKRNREIIDAEVNEYTFNNHKQLFVDLLHKQLFVDFYKQLFVDFPKEQTEKNLH